MKVIYRIEEPSVVRKTYDYAAWWTDIEIAPGDYEVRFVTIDGRECEPSEAYFARVTLQGKVVDEYMAAHFGGVPVKGSPRHREGRIGESETKVVSQYRHTVNRFLEDPSEPQWGPGRFMWVFE